MKTRILLAALATGAVVAAGITACDPGDPEFQCEDVALALAGSVLDPGFTATDASAIWSPDTGNWFLAIELATGNVGVWLTDNIDPRGPHSYVSVDHVADAVSPWPRFADENLAVATQTSDIAKAVTACVENR